VRSAGQVAILPFPHTDFAAGKARLVLLLARVPGPFEDRGTNPAKTCTMARPERGEIWLVRCVRGALGVFHRIGW